MKKLISLLLLAILICPVVFADDTDRSVEFLLNRTFRNDSINHGRKVVATAGTDLQVSTTSQRYGTVTLCAETNNTGVMCVGGTGVDCALSTRTGVPLTAGACLTLQSSGNLDEIFIDATVTGDGVTYAFTN